MAKHCMNCGAAADDNARFCSKCGTAFRPAATPTNRSADRTSKRFVRNTAAIGATIPFEESVRQTVGERDQAVSAAPACAFGPSGRIKGTFSVLFGQIGSMIGGFFKVFTKLKALLFTVAISALWIWLNHLRLFEGLDGISAMLSKLTYSRGGTGGTVLEIIGGTIGKGIVGAGLCSILYGGIGKMFRGIGNLFSEPGFNIGAAILGFGTAALAYQFTAGFAGEDGFMVGVAGAMCALEALSVREGFLVNLAASFSARKTGADAKELLPGRYKGFLTGAAIGFLVWMIFTLAGTAENLAYDFDSMLYGTFNLDIPAGLVTYLVPILLIFIGLIVNAVGKGAKNA